MNADDIRRITGDGWIVVSGHDLSPAEVAHIMADPETRKLRVGMLGLPVRVSRRCPKDTAFLINENACRDLSEQYLRSSKEGT